MRKKEKRYFVCIPKYCSHAKNQKILPHRYPGKLERRQTDRHTDRDGPEFNGPIGRYRVAVGPIRDFP